MALLLADIVKLRRALFIPKDGTCGSNSNQTERMRDEDSSRITLSLN